MSKEAEQARAYLRYGKPYCGNCWYGIRRADGLVKCNCATGGWWGWVQSSRGVCEAHRYTKPSDV